MTKKVLALIFSATLAVSLLLQGQTDLGQRLIKATVTSDSTYNYAADAGASDTYVITLAPAITTYATGACYTFKANTANTGAATLNINGLGAKTIKKVAGGITTDLADNDIRAGQFVDVCYDGTNLQMQSTLGNAPAGSGDITRVGDCLTGDCFTGLTFPGGTDNVVARASTDTLTGKTIDPEATGNVIGHVNYLTFYAGSVQAGTAGTGFNTPSSNAPAATAVVGTNTIYGTLAFDAATDESIQGSFPLPTGWTGAIDVEFMWRAASTSGDVIWAIQGISIADAETGDPAFSAAQTVTDTAKGTTLQWNTATISSMTTTGFAAGETVLFKIYRDADAGGDTMAGDAELIWVKFTVRRNQ